MEKWGERRDGEIFGRGGWVHCAGDFWSTRRRKCPGTPGYLWEGKHPQQRIYSNIVYCKKAIFIRIDLYQKSAYNPLYFQTAAHPPQVLSVLYMCLKKYSIFRKILFPPKSPQHKKYKILSTQNNHISPIQFTIHFYLYISEIYLKI